MFGVGMVAAAGGPGIGFTPAVICPTTLCGCDDLDRRGGSTAATRLCSLERGGFCSSFCSFFSDPFKQSFELNIQRAIMLFTGYNLQDGVPWYMAVLSLSILHVYKV